MCELITDHTPVLLTLGAKVFKKTGKQNLTNRLTDWNQFREVLA